jgi:hypothetical protein
MTSRNRSTLKLVLAVTLLAAPLAGCRSGRTPAPAPSPAQVAAAIEPAASCSATPAPAPRRRIPLEEGCTDPTVAARLARR